MNVLIYGNARDKEIIIQHMTTQACMAFRMINYFQTEDYEEFLEHLHHKKFGMIFVMADSAAGMEGVIASKNLHPSTPVIWFSNDKNFVAQSYRLGVDYFSVKPINEKIMELAIARCRRREELQYE